jgi:hypothetical protein
MAHAAPVQLGNRRRRRALAGAVMLVVVGSLTIGACGSGAAGPPGTSAPSTSAGAGGGGSTTPPPCPRLAASANPAGSPVVLDTAALLTATITVVPGAGGPTCTILRPGGRVTLRVGQRVELVANHTPSLSGVPPSAGTGAVGMTTAPGPTSTGPGGAPSTSHLAVTITARRPGSVLVRWIDCSGTAC